ncbi:MAG: hypothetical protein IKU52_02815 [Clostridia bacterium]|nr:hypothetical protein [Clostridia bacterium]
MKALKVLLCVALLCATLLPTAVFAEEPYVDNFITEVGEIDCPYGTPVIDGVINTGEGWSEGKYIDKTNTDGCWGGEEVVITGYIYRAWDKDNLYLAADISIPEYTICTGEDTIEADRVVGNRPGWDGDVFVYSIDPLQALLNEGFMKDAAPWYCFGLFEGGDIKTYRTHLNDGEITEKIPGKGSQTETGWRFEVALPWTQICDDIKEYSFGDAALTPELVAKAGNKISGAMIYYDRVYDPEQQGMITGSRYVTIANVLPDGTPGPTSSGWILDAHGMHFIMSGGPAADEGSNGETNGNNTNNNQGNANTNTNTNNSTNSGTTNSGTTTKPGTTTNNANKGSATGTSSPQTFDASFAYAAVALFISAIALHFIMKKKTVVTKKQK